jgi:hypothetical protein
MRVLMKRGMILRQEGTKSRTTYEAGRYYMVDDALGREWCKDGLAVDSEASREQQLAILSKEALEAEAVAVLGNVARRKLNERKRVTKKAWTQMILTAEGLTVSDEDNLTSEGEEG